MKKPGIQAFARKILLAQITRLDRELSGIGSARSIASVHESRVACRRLKNSLWIFKKIFPKKKHKILCGYTRQIASLLGPCRDVDVQIAFVQSVGRTAVDPRERSGLKELSAVLRSERKKLTRQIAENLDSSIKNKILSDLRRALPKALPSRGGFDPELRKLADKKTRESLQELMAFESCVRFPRRVEELHQMRIAVKKLRYTLENFSLAYDPRLSYFVRKLRALQRELGDLHDREVFLAKLKKIGKTKDLGSASGFIRAVCQTRSRNNFAAFTRIWKDYEKIGFWSKLREYIRT